MRDSMPILSALNLKEVHIRAWTNPNNPDEKYLEDKIPVSAFNAQGGGGNSTLVNFVFPDRLKAIADNAFTGCKYLSGSLLIPEGVEEIDEEAFPEYLLYLKRIVIPSHWQNIPQWLMKKWINIEVPENNPYFMTIDGVIYSKDKRKLIRYSREKKEKSFTIPEEVEEIGSYAFVHCDYLTDIKIPKKVNMIQDNTFWYCENLCNVLFLSEDTITIQPDGFIGCSKVDCFEANSPDLRVL